MYFDFEIAMKIHSFRLNTIYYFDEFVNRNIMKYSTKCIRLCQDLEIAKLYSFHRKLHCLQDMYLT